MDQELRVEIDRGIAQVTFDASAEMNAYTPERMARLAGLVRTASRRSDVDAIVIRGAEGVFCIGAAATLLQRMRDSDATVRRRIIRDGQEVIRSIVESNKLTVAAVNGFAAGGGVDLLLSCDRVFVTDDAQVNLFYGKLGLLPDHGAVWFLRERLGHDRALAFCLQSPRLDAKRCMELGLAHGRILGTEECGEWRRILRADLRSPRSAREALKALLSGDRRQAIGAHLDAVREVQVTLLAGAEQDRLIERVAQMQRWRTRDRERDDLSGVGSTG